MKHTILLLVTACSAFFSTAQLQQNALSFDGVNDYISSPLPAVFTNLLQNDFTFEAWINSQSSSTNRVFFAQQDNSNFATLLISTNLIFYVKVGNVTYSSSIAMPPLGQWTHVAVTWDASIQLPSIYVNGVRQSGIPGGSSSSGINNTMTLGSRTDGLQLFNGEMDEVRIWNTARKECEIRSMMHSVPVGNEPDLITNYNFNRGTAGQNNASFTFLPDIVGPNTGTLLNFALNGATSNWVSSAAQISATGPQNAYETNDAATICEGDAYTLGSQNLTATGVYQETFTSVEGCDSLVTLQLTVRQVHMPPVIQASCSSYFWEQTGEIYTTSGIYSDTLASSYGCDSILTLELTINQHTASSFQIDTCGSYFWTQTGETYTVGGMYMDTIPNAAGCDSLITLQLIIRQPSASTWPVEACGYYQWGQTGETYTISGLYRDTIPNNAGCDSVITLELTILEPTASTLTASACGSYYWGQTGLTYHFSGSYKDTISNAAGCDSVVTLSLLINQLPQGTIVYDGQATLSVNTFHEVVEWIDCSTGQTIPGQQGQSTFIPTENGSYAAILENTMSLCRDTSNCYPVGFVDIREYSLLDLHIAPNPAQDQVTVTFNGETSQLTVWNAQGKQVLVQTIENGANIPLITLESGVYLFKLQTAGGTAIQRVVKR